jgi:hypothetical protein
VERKNTHKVFTAASERTIKVKSGHHPQHHHPCINIHLGQQQGKLTRQKRERERVIEEEVIFNSFIHSKSHLQIDYYS